MDNIVIEYTIKGLPSGDKKDKISIVDVTSAKSAVLLVEKAAECVSLAIRDVIDKEFSLGIFRKKGE